MTERLRALLCAPLMLIAIMLSPVALASSVVQRPIAAIVEESPLIFEGRVSATRVEGSGKQIRTWVTFDVLDVIKGDYPEPQISLRYIGGTAGGKTLRLGDQTIPGHGEHGIYFVESLDGQTVHPLRGWGQGHFILQRDPAGGGYIVKNSENKVVTGLSVRKDSESFTTNSRSAAGVITLEEMDAGELQKPLSRERFKKFITELAQ